MRRKTNICLGVAVAALFCAGSTMGQNPATGPTTRTTASSSSDHLARGGFGRPEAITGNIVMVEPERGILVISVPLSQPNTTRLIGTEHIVQAGNVVESEQKTTAIREPGDTDYAFKVSGNTLITHNGRPVLLADLAGYIAKR